MTKENTSKMWKIIQETIFIDYVNHIQYIALKIYKKAII